MDLFHGKNKNKNKNNNNQNKPKEIVKTIDEFAMDNGIFFRQFFDFPLPVTNLTVLMLLNSVMLKNSVNPRKLMTELNYS